MFAEVAGEGVRQDRPQFLRAAVLWAANPLLLQLLIAGAHVDGQAVFFGVAAVAVLFGPWAGERAPVPSLSRPVLAGTLAGLGFAVKVSDVVVGLGLAVALVLRPRAAAGSATCAITAPTRKKRCRRSCTSTPTWRASTPSMVFSI